MSATAAQPQGPLAGLKVLDISNVIAGPFAAALLGDLGAAVTKVELPGGGDPLRGFPPQKDGKPLIWKVTNRNKRAITLDLRKADGKALFLRLLTNADVLVENYRPGTLDKWGLDKATLWGVNPGLVILRLTGFGQDGPYRNYPGFARLFEAYAGLTFITGEADGPPLHTGYPIGDPIGGVFGAFSAVAALLHRARNPGAPGQEIDLSLTEAMLKILEVLAIKADQTGEVLERMGNDNAYVAPANVFRAGDGHWVTVTCATQAIFERFCALIGQPELLSDPRFATNMARMQHKDLLNAKLGEWIAARPLTEAVRVLMEAGVSAAPVYDAKQILADPHFKARAAIVSVPDADFGSVRMPGVVPRFSRTPGAIRSTGPALGAHNAEIYGRELGLSEAELERLRAGGVI
ncbi:MAG: CoA transferase [Proteobacteria bacterium]|nr:CoA transferase [Pseudomonadota bacterium]